MKKILAVICFTMLISTFSLVCYAAGETGNTSYKTISSSAQGASGPVVQMQGNIKLSGENYSSSTNTLYVCINRSLNDTNTKWEERYSRSISVGYTLNPYSYPGNPLGNYRVLLDPSGALSTGCNGWGRIRNQA